MEITRGDRRGHDGDDEFEAVNSRTGYPLVDLPKCPRADLTGGHTGDMDRDGRRPRRLRVSALAAVANPSYSRLDTWNLLDDACHQLAVVDRAGLDTSHEAARAKRLVNRLSAYERYWIYPGAENLATFREYLDNLATVSLAEKVSLAVRLLSEYGDRAALFDTSTSLADQELVARAKEQQFYTVLLADDSPVHRARGLGGMPARAARRWRRRAVRAAGGDQRRGRHHRGRVERGDSGGDHPARHSAAVPRPGAVDDHIARRQRRSGGHRPHPRLGRMRRVDPRTAATHRPLPAHRRVDRFRDRR